ncbi:MAG: ferrous iron transporter B [Clostridia bacterium]|nr:ferrous iron transporter B [Clostridia bacterium]
MEIKIALAGNPNSGKTTLFNALTGSNQFVGNWPGVTVEKKEGKIKRHENVILTDLPGIYSLSPYTLEEVVARNYILNENPSAILNIVDGTNLERNLYLTTQLVELGVPVVVAINMADIIRKNGDEIDLKKLSKLIGCKFIEISALKGTGISELAEVAIAEASEKKTSPIHKFSADIETAIEKISALIAELVPEEKKRWYAVKLFERDEKAIASLGINDDAIAQIEGLVSEIEKKYDDDAESIITNERYNLVTDITSKCLRKRDDGKPSVSERIDRIVTNRWLALPIFAIIMFLVYFISVTTIGTWATDWTNDGLFGDGFHLFGMNGDYDEVLEEHTEPIWSSATLKELVERAEDKEIAGAGQILEAIDKKDFEALEESYGSYGPALVDAGYPIDIILDPFIEGAPDPSEYGVWVKGIPVLVSAGLEKINCTEWLSSLIVDGIVGGVGAVLGFVPQMLVLFLLLAFLEACGYMARIAFVMDRIFRKLGLSGKSFIPMLIGTGCSVPGIMASRTIENQRDRRMTIMTTSFIPCGAKLPIIALISGALFGGAWWVAPSAYFLGIVAVVISGLILKKTKPFVGDPSPFILELPAYHMPTIINLLRSMWERGWSFIKKAGTIILLSTIVIWATSHLGNTGDGFGFALEMELADSILGYIGNALKWIFIPVGFGSIQATVATFMGLLAKEEVVAVFGVLDFFEMSKVAGYAFLAFNLLCAPCFAAIGAIKREMNSAKWTWFAIGYQCVLAYLVALIIYWLGSLFTGALFGTISTVASVLGLVSAVLAIAFIAYMIARPKDFSIIAKVKSLIKK